MGLNGNRDGRATIDDIRDVTWHVRAEVAVDQPISSTSLADITALSVTATASGLYEFEATLYLNSPDTAGFEVGVNGPSGATVIALVSGSTTTTAGSSCNVQALNTKSTTAFCAINGIGVCVIKGWMLVSSTTGNLTIQIDKKTSGTGTVLRGSVLRTRRVY